MSSRRTRVLHVIQNLNYGGMERLLADLVRGVNAGRFESHVLVLQYVGRFGEGLERHATIHQAASPRRLSFLWPTSLARSVRAIGPDVVHAHSGVWSIAARAARMAGVPRVIYTEHGRPSPDTRLAQLIDGVASRRTDVAVAVSRSVAELLRTKVVRGRCTLQLIVNGIDTDRFWPRSSGERLRAELRLDAATPIIGSVGRLEHIKGYDVMIEAYAALQRRQGSRMPALVIVGDGSQRPQLEHRAKALGIAKHVHFLGWRDDIEATLSAFDLFTLSSRNEGTSISLLEAMAAGTCPVVTEVGGNAAVLGSDLAHRLVATENPPALAAAWVDALSDDTKRRKDADSARQRVVATHALADMVASYERLYAGAENPVWPRRHSHPVPPKGLSVAPYDRALTISVEASAVAETHGRRTILQHLSCSQRVQTCASMIRSWHACNSVVAACR